MKKNALFILVCFFLSIILSLQKITYSNEGNSRTKSSGQSNAVEGHNQWKEYKFAEAAASFQLAADKGFSPDWMRILWAHSEFRLGHIALANENWVEAERIYANGLKRGTGLVHPVFTALPVYLEIARRCKQVKTLKPKELHRVLMVYVEKSDFRVTRPEEKHVVSALTEQHIDHAEIGIGVTRAFWVAATGGQIGLDVQTVRWNGTLRKVRDERVSSSYPYKHWFLNYETLFEDLGPVIGSLIDKFDTIYIVWSAEEMNVADARTVSIPRAGSGQRYASRGAVQICGERLLEAPGALTVHEFFHIYERLVGIERVHGFQPSNRLWFPEWKGVDEADYYLWQMEMYPNRRPYAR